MKSVKKVLLLLAFMFVCQIGFAQKKYSKIYELGEYHKEWAMVKTVAGTYGFIDANGKVVVNPVYEKIYKFDVIRKNWAMVKSVSGTYGFIDAEGNEVVRPVYEKIYNFGDYRKDWALVRTVAGTYGFIDSTGKEIVTSNQTLKQIESQYKFKVVE